MTIAVDEEIEVDVHSILGEPMMTIQDTVSITHDIMLTQMQVRKLLPILQRFVETGSIEEKKESEATQ